VVDDVDDGLGFVLDRFNRMLAADGASLGVVSLQAGVLTLRYGSAGGGACEACVLQPADLRELVGEALIGRSSGVKTVEILSD
jgi:Fe-S cluster biogenesis protein NfuA